MILQFCLILLGILIGMRIMRLTRVASEQKRADFYQDVAEGYEGESLLLINASQTLLFAQMEHFADPLDEDKFVQLAIARDDLERILENINYG